MKLSKNEFRVKRVFTTVNTSSVMNGSLAVNGSYTVNITTPPKTRFVPIGP